MATLIDHIKKCKKVIITGAVGVGKSTIIDSVKTYLNSTNVKWIYIPEYIDVKEDALDQLNKYLHKEISVFEFQSYIIRFYEEYLTSLTDITGEEILIFERGLSDAIACFSNLDYYHGHLTFEEFYELFQMARNVEDKFDMPSYFTNADRFFLPVKTKDPRSDGEIIGSVIINRHVHNIVIGLYNSAKTCYERMLVRNRPGEAESYPYERIKSFTTSYDRLYAILMKHDKIDFTYLRKLIDED